MMTTLPEKNEIAIGTNGVSHWLIVDGQKVKISRREYFELLTADDNEIDMMLAIMTGQGVESC